MRSCFRVTLSSQNVCKLKDNWVRVWGSLTDIKLWWICLPTAGDMLELLGFDKNIMRETIIVSLTFLQKTYSLELEKWISI